MAVERSTRLLRLPDVIRITGLSRSMIYLLISEKDFPQSVQLSKRTVGWPEDEVYWWTNARIARREATSQFELRAVDSRELASRALRRTE